MVLLVRIHQRDICNLCIMACFIGNGLGLKMFNVRDMSNKSEMTFYRNE